MAFIHQGCVSVCWCQLWEPTRFIKMKPYQQSNMAAAWWSGAALVLQDRWLAGTTNLQIDGTMSSALYQKTPKEDVGCQFVPWSMKWCSAFRVSGYGAEWWSKTHQSPLKRGKVNKTMVLERPGQSADLNSDRRSYSKPSIKAYSGVHSYCIHNANIIIQ